MMYYTYGPRTLWATIVERAALGFCVGYALMDLILTAMGVK